MYTLLHFSAIIRTISTKRTVLLSTIGVDRKAGADPRNSKTTAKRTCLKTFENQNNNIEDTYLNREAEEGAGMERGRGRGGETPSTLKVPQGPSTRPIWLCHAFRILNAMIISILYVYKTLTISY